MVHYHFHTEKQVVSDGVPKVMTCNFIVGEDYGDQEQKVALAMGYAVKWNRCTEDSCFGGRQTA